MPVNNLNFQGINRAMSDYNADGACEELINLRPTTGGLVPVKPFTVTRSNSTYEKVFVHSASSRDNRIGLLRGTNTVTIKLMSDAGVTYDSEIGTLTIPSGVSIDKIHFAYAGNVILFSVKDKEHSFYLNAAYIWKMDANGVFGYSVIDGSIPTLTASLSPGTPQLARARFVRSDDDSEAASRERMNSELDKLEIDNPSMCFGHVIVAIAFKTIDGQTIWTGNWMAFDPFLHINRDIAEQDGWWVTWQDAEQNTYHGYGLIYPRESVSPIRYSQFAGVPISVVIHRIDGWNEQSSIVSSVEIYASRPVRYLDMESTSNLIAERLGIIYVVPEDIPNMNLGGQLLYHQASVSLRDLSAAQQTVALSFGGNIQVTEETLEVDSGAIKRYGNVIAYNARFHFFDSASETAVGKPYFSQTPYGSPVTAYVIVDYEDAKTRRRLYVGTESIYPVPFDRLPKIVIAPSLSIKAVYLYYYSNDSWRTATYNMMQSSAYNYSIYAADSPPVPVSGTNTEFDNLIANPYNVTTALFNEEPDAINVTEQYSPFVFMVEHSYLAPGKVLDVQPQMYTDADSSFGLYPLNVFTTRGLYALNQGSANVLYGDFDALSNLVSESNSIPTEIGTFFISEGSLWLVAGRHTTLISDALHLGPHKEIRTCAGFVSLVSDDKYLVSGLLSVPTFDVYVSGGVVGGNTIGKATLSYNRHRNEIYISNQAYSYSYALSLKYRQWFKIGIRIWQDAFSGTIANTPGGSAGTINVVDMTQEKDESVLVHMQSRPFSIGYQYSHVHRMVCMIKAALATTDKLIVSLYGSDNLQDWVLLACAARNSTSTATPTPDKLKISQIRTAGAARSWRYYTVCMGGTTPTDTDFGPVIYEYQPVVRRIG